LSKIINELEAAEENLKNALIPFLNKMFDKFFESRVLFTRAIQCVAELDCLNALAIISSNTEYGPMTRPVILEKNGDEPYIELRGLRHPCVQQ
jgi:DNA mismatch repair ATPase MutS